MSDGECEWDERYANDEYAYGNWPDDFPRSQIAHLPKRRILRPAEDEDRNAMFLAEQCYEVTAFDQSPAGLSKAHRLAEQRGISVDTVVADLAAFKLGQEVWDGIFPIFAHMPITPSH